MLELWPELLAELLSLAVYTLGAGLLTVLGLAAEYRGLTELAGGVSPLGLWLAGVGLVALYAGIYAVGYRELLPRLVDRAA